MGFCCYEMCLLLYILHESYQLIWTISSFIPDLSILIMYFLAEVIFHIIFKYLLTIEVNGQNKEFKTHSIRGKFKTY